MTVRLASLYLRSRLTGGATAAVAAVAALAWLFLDLSEDRSLTTLLLTVMPVGAAVVVGASARSPFGEAERTASFSLPALRLGHLGGLLAWAGLALAAANTAAPGDAAAWTLVRNGAGYAGLALLGSRLLGAGVAWVPPVAYGVAVFVVWVGLLEPKPERWWLWPVQDGADGSAWATALVLLGGGLAVAAQWGPREESGEVA